MKVILPACEIQLGSTVTKATGAVEFLLTDTLSIYHADGRKEDIKATLGTRFLIPKECRGSISTIPASLELAWVTNKRELYQWLQDEEYDREDK